MTIPKIRLTFWQIINMNVGFFGIQYSFGLQQSNMSPIYKYLGAEEGSLPYLWLAGPVTGLIVQPFIGAFSDRTWTRFGRRTPYFLFGAILCSIGLLLMPFSSSLWMAASLLWILDAANNVTMEPYRAFVSDKLLQEQHSLGFLTQSAFTGLAQTLSYLTPTLLVLLGMNQDWVNDKNIPYSTVAAFLIGAFFSIASILWSFKTTREHPLSNEEIEQIKASPRGFGDIIAEIADAIRDMPSTMKQLAIVKLFQWYGIFCYWQFITLSVSTTFFQTTLETSSGFREAHLITGQTGGFYNFIAFAGAFALVPLTNRWGPKITHSLCLFVAGVSMIFIPLIHEKIFLFIPMIGIGLAWASMMGNTYVMLAGSIPAHRTGVYMGIFNMFIVIPMMIQIFTLPLYYESWLDSNPENVIRLAGALFIGGSIAVLFVRIKAPASGLENIPLSTGH
jgi:maltose/moltooligosaccharide transporter